MPRALGGLGYSRDAIDAIALHITQHGHVVDAPGLDPEHYSVFDCAMGQRSIAPMGHVRMMAAVQPFLSGAISKTVNLPQSATVDDVAQVYFQGWKMGLKGRGDLPRQLQGRSALSAEKGDRAAAAVTPNAAPTPAASASASASSTVSRRRLPKSRASMTTSFTVAGAEGYFPCPPTWKSSPTCASNPRE